MAIRIPGQAVEQDPPESQDLGAPTVDLLRSVSLLPEDGDQQQAGGVRAAVLGPPDSVSVIEAGATAAAKWWSTAIGTSAAAMAGLVTAIWGSLAKGSSWNQPFAILALAVIAAAAIIGIAYLLGSDVRGRAAATVATIEARQRVATAMIREASERFTAPDHAESGATPIGLSPLPARNTRRPSEDEPGWRAVAMREGKSGTEYFLVKGGQSSWVGAAHVVFL